MNFKTKSAILRGNWLIDLNYAKAQLPFVLKMINNRAAIDSPDNAQLHKLTHLSLLSESNVIGLKSSVCIISPNTSIDIIPYNSIAMINLIGPILKYSDSCSFGMVEYNNLFIRLANSDKVRGIILNIDSPGGQSEGTGTFTETIRSVIKTKPIISVINDGTIAGSAVWIACSAQEIYATRSTCQIGGIGFYYTLYDFEGYFKANGIKIHEIYAPQSIDKNKDYKNALRGEYDLIESQLQLICKEFIDSVSINRGQRLKTKVNDPFTGKMYFAHEAITIGLIDGIKSIREIIRRLEELIALRT